MKNEIQTGDAPAPTLENAPPYDLSSQAFLADPHPTFRRMRAEDPVYWHPLMRAWFVTRYDDIQSVCRDVRFASKKSDRWIRQAPADMKDKVEAYDRRVSDFMVFLDSSRRSVLRTLIAKAFTPKVIDSLRPFAERLVDDAIDAVSASGRMDVIRDLADPIPALVLGETLRISSKDVGPIKAWTNDVFAPLGSRPVTEETLEVGARAISALDGYFLERIAELRGHPGDDLLSRLIAVEEQGAVLSETEISATCVLLLAAGHETTTNFIGNAVLALLRNPDQLALLRAHPELIEGAVEELMRFDGAAMMIARQALEEVELRGKRIEARQMVFCMLLAGNRDPARYPDPDRLDITRKDIRSLGFGHGIHFCIGAALARMEVQVALRKIVERLPDLRLAAETLEWLPMNAVRGVPTLPVAFQAREK